MGWKSVQDGAGNLSAIYRSADDSAKTLMIGSHLDSVIRGGRYDGALGVVAALEATCSIKDAGIQLPFHLEVISFTDEEGTHLGVMGSQAVAGMLSQEDVDHPHSGVDVFQAGLERVDISKESILNAKRDGDDLLGYIELHIEQGSRLEKAGVDIGLVTHIVGMRHYWLTFEGVARHAGTTAMDERKDAFWGASEFVLRAKDHVLHNHMPGVVTCGKIEVEPSAFNIIPGIARLGLEFRHGTDEQLDQKDTELLNIAIQVAEQYELGLETESLMNVPAGTMDAGLGEHILKASESLNLSHQPMMSFAYHDPLPMSMITPSVMFFVPSVDGISHNPKEYTKPDDCVNGANVLLQTVLSVADSMTD